MTEGRRLALAAAMAKHGWAPTGPAAWTSTLTNGVTVPVAACVEQQWLHIDAEIPDLPDAPLFAWLRANAILPAPVRLVLADHAAAEPRLHLTADLAIEERGDWVSRIAGVTAALVDGLHIVRFGHVPDDDLDSAAPLPASLGDRLREAAWNEATRDDRSVSVSLGEESRGAMAEIAARGQTLVAWVAVGRSVSGADETRAEAVATFMLLAARRLRSVRAAARCDGRDGALTVGWQHRLPLVPDADELERALAVLTIAHAISHREVTALASQTFAECYLNRRGARPHAHARIAAAP